MKKFCVLLVGCGGMANTWIKYLKSRDDVHIAGLCDIIADKAEEMKARYNIECEVFDEMKKAFGNNNALGINLVADCTTPDAHEYVVTTALGFGCNVIGEKPMAETRVQALNEIAAANTAGKTYSVMQNRIYLPGMRAIRKAVDDNIIGKLGYIGSDFFIGAHFGGFRDIMDNVLILDMAVHTFYQARFIVGSNPVSVYCHEYNPAGSWYKGNASAVAVFEFANGVVYNYTGSWCAEGHNTSWECDWRFVGETGSIKWNGSDKPVAEVKSPGENKFINAFNRIEIDMPAPKKNYGHEGCFDEMFDALLEGRPAETDCRENYYSMNMVYGAIESAKCGRKIFLD